MMAASSRRGEQKGKGRLPASPDPGQQAALEKAADALRNSNGDASKAAEACITAWIMQRAVDAAKDRQSSENYILTLGDTRVASVASACLGTIANTLGAEGVDLSKTLFDMDKETIIQLFTVVYLAMRDNLVSQYERPSDIPFDDEIPF